MSFLRPRAGPRQSPCRQSRARWNQRRRVRTQVSLLGVLQRWRPNIQKPLTSIEPAIRPRAIGGRGARALAHYPALQPAEWYARFTQIAPSAHDRRNENEGRSSPCPCIRRRPRRPAAPQAELRAGTPAVRRCVCAIHRRRPDVRVHTSNWLAWLSILSRNHRSQVVKRRSVGTPIAAPPSAKAAGRDVSTAPRSRMACRSPSQCRRLPGPLVHETSPKSWCPPESK